MVFGVYIVGERREKSEEEEWKRKQNLYKNLLQKKKLDKEKIIINKAFQTIEK